MINRAWTVVAGLLDIAEPIIDVLIDAREVREPAPRELEIVVTRTGCGRWIAESPAHMKGYGESTLGPWAAVCALLSDVEWSADK